MTSVHTVTENVVDHVKGKLSLPNDSQPLCEKVEISDGFFESLQGTVDQAQDSPDETAKGNIFPLHIVRLETGLLYFGYDCLAEVETATLWFDQWELVCEILLDSRLKIRHKVFCRESHFPYLQCFPEQ